ncbi:unnamed protein product [Allacma fusca]|uniref:BZIP domain-containing protein n=1 Tax=Allacma fusca TaxID=39272 RepID=A0A8J2LS90_9HEXA|nr:unnamed protein product [Allacma fusca]
MEENSISVAVNMIYVQQIRSRKESLVPFRQEVDADMKFEIVDVSTLNGVELLGMDSEQFIEVVTSPGTPASMSAESPRPRKRAKLDHLSVEEKAQHRKMMNRISAQSARDRQKAFIVQQEKAIKIITTENDALKEENKTLKAKSDKLVDENVSLKAMIADYENKFKKMSSMMPSAPVTIKEEPKSETEATECCGPFEPAVLSTIPLQKGPELQQTQILSPESQFVEQIIASESSNREASSNVAELGNNESGFAWLVNTENTTPASIDTVSTTTGDREDDTHSSHSESSLPLEEAAFGLLPNPVSPVTPIITTTVEDAGKKQHTFLMEKFDNFNAFLDSGFEISDSWNDEQLFPDLTIREDMY